MPNRATWPALAVLIALAGAGALTSSCASTSVRPPSSPPPSRLSCPAPSSGAPGDAVTLDASGGIPDLDYGSTVTGRVQITAGHHLWLAAYGPATKRWFPLGEVAGQRSGTFTSMPIYLGDGSGEDDGKYFCLAALVVTPEVDASLRNYMQPAVNWINELPPATVHAVVVHLRHGQRPSTAAPPPSPPSCPTPPPGAAGDTVAFANLHDGSPIDFGDRATGHATLAADHHLWLLAYGPAVRRWYLFGEITPSAEGSWTTMPITLGDGSGDDDNRYFCIGAFAVDANVHTALQRTHSQAPDHFGSIIDLPPATAHVVLVLLRHGERTAIVR